MCPGAETRRRGAGRCVDAGASRARAEVDRRKKNNMAKVEMYTTMWCGYCARARNLLQRKGVDFEDIDVEVDTSKRTEMVQRAGGRTTVPQIFIDGVHVG